MSAFKDMVLNDNAAIFMNLDEFADKRIIVYNGITYSGEDGDGIAALLTKIKEKDRVQIMSDHAQGLYRVTAVLHCTLEDLGGVMPEKGQWIKIGDEEFLQDYYVAASAIAAGMLRVELEAIDE